MQLQSLLWRRPLVVTVLFWRTCWTKQTEQQLGRGACVAKKMQKTKKEILEDLWEKTGCSGCEELLIKLVEQKQVSQDDGLIYLIISTFLTTLYGPQLNKVNSSFWKWWAALMGFVIQRMHAFTSLQRIIVKCSYRIGRQQRHRDCSKEISIPVYQELHPELLARMGGVG